MCVNPAVNHWGINYMHQICSRVSWYIFFPQKTKSNIYCKYFFLLNDHKWCVVRMWFTWLHVEIPGTHNIVREYEYITCDGRFNLQHSECHLMYLCRRTIGVQWPFQISWTIAWYWFRYYSIVYWWRFPCIKHTELRTASSGGGYVEPSRWGVVSNR